jgi:hypothetical protein
MNPAQWKIFMWRAEVLSPKDFRTQWRLLGPADRSEIRRYALRAQPHPEASKAVLIVGFCEWQLSRWWLVPSGLLYAVSLHLLGAAVGMYSPISCMPMIWIGVALWLILGYPYLVSRWVRAARVNRATGDGGAVEGRPYVRSWCMPTGGSRMDIPCRLPAGWHGYEESGRSNCVAAGQSET